LLTQPLLLSSPNLLAATTAGSLPDMDTALFSGATFPRIIALSRSRLPILKRGLPVFMGNLVFASPVAMVQAVL